MVSGNLIVLNSNFSSERPQKGNPNLFGGNCDRRQTRQSKDAANGEKSNEQNDMVIASFEIFYQANRDEDQR